MHICNPSSHEKKARDSGIQGHLPLCSVFRVSLSYIEILSQTHIRIRMHTHIRMHRHKSKKQNISIFEKMFLKISYSIFWTYFCPENLFLNLEKCLQGLGLLCLKARWVFFPYQASISFTLLKLLSWQLLWLFSPEPMLTLAVIRISPHCWNAFLLILYSFYFLSTSLTQFGSS